MYLQLNISTTATLGREESDHCGEVAVSGGLTVIFLFGNTVTERNEIIQCMDCPPKKWPLWRGGH